MKVAIIIFLVLAAILSVFTLVAIIFDMLRSGKKSNESENQDKATGDSAESTAQQS